MLNGCQGPTCKYCCIYCHKVGIIDGVKRFLLDGIKAKLRTIGDLYDCLKRFHQSGKDIGDAMDFYNVVNFPVLKNLPMDALVLMIFMPGMLSNRISLLTIFGH